MSIQPIPQPSIQRLVAGQAITDLTSAVKELLENAVDAAAGRVVVKLYDQGLSSIQVSDNGTGVPKSCRSLLAAKHATSKLRSFGDLYGGNGSQVAERAENADPPSNAVSTLGFRGEALFSLANLSSSLTVSTRTSDESAGEELTFDSSGNVISRRPVARAVGTTVTVGGFLERLPVRRVDFVKRIKSQRLKLIKIMQGYAILCLGIQFQLVDVNASKPKLKSETVRLATSDSATTATLETRVASILSTQFLEGLTRVEIDLSAAVDDNDSRWKVRGLVSHSPASPYPSTAREAHLFSINGRPVDLPAVSRIVGEVWKTHDSEGGRRPACLLAFALPHRAYDVNLSPDKRQVLFTEETAILGLLKEGLAKVWSEQSRGKFEANEVERKSNGGAKGCARVVTMDGRDGDVVVANDVSSTALGKEEFNTITPRPRRKATDGEPRPANDQFPIGNKTIITPTVSQTQHDDVQTSAKHQNETKELTSATDAQENESSHRNDRSNISRPAKPSPKERRMWEQMKLNFNRANKPAQQKEVEQLPSSDEGIAGETESLEIAAAKSDTDSVQKDKFPTHDELPIAQELIARPKRKATGGVESFLNSFAFGSSKTSTITESCGIESSAAEPAAEDELHATSRCQTSMLAEPAEFTRPKRKARDDASCLNSFACGSSKSAKRKPTAESDGEESSPDEQPEETANGAFDLKCASAMDGPVHRSGRMVIGQRIISEKRRRSMQGRARELEGVSSNSSRRSQLQSSRDDSSAADVQQEEDSDPIHVPFETVWGSFTGTANVIAQSQQSKVILQKKRTILQTSMDLKNAGNDNAKFTVSNSTNVDLDRNDFIHMSIIGQFNNGFILARCPNHNLWILDQHACDEKYNFERLCKEMVIHEQRLITPLPLELSPTEEHCILEHMNLFEKNGFRFDYNPEKEPRHRISITALPHSGSGGDGTKAVQFGKEDVLALCAMLGADGTSSGHVAGCGIGADGTGLYKSNAVRRFAGAASGSGDTNGVIGSSIVRLPKAIAMFASRACRKSIMIGTALSHKEQREILKKLEKTDDPWNCAHGRPTMSHIRSLARCLIEDNDVAADHFAGSMASML